MWKNNEYVKKKWKKKYASSYNTISKLNTYTW